MFFYVLLAHLTLSVAHDARVEYVNNGALLLTPGNIKLNNPSPVALVVENFENCVGSVSVCYKSISSAATFECDPGYCSMEINFSPLRSFAAQIYTTGNTAEIVLKKNSFCDPVTVDGYHSFKIASLASNCRVIVKGATDPDPTTTTTTTTTEAEVTVTETDEDVETASEKASDAMIWGIVGGGVGLVVILMVIAVLVFIFVIRPCLARRAANRRRNRANAVASSKALPMGCTPASKANPTPAKTPETPAPSTTQSKQGINAESVEPEVAATSKPVPPEEPKPEDVPAAEPKPKKVALTPAEYEELIPIVESVLASLCRLNHIDRDILESVFARWRPGQMHDVWKLEKIILQARADESIEALNQLTAELDVGLLKNKAKYGSNDSPDETWEYANFEGLPASASHRLFAMSYPDVFKGIEGRLDDPIIEKLSVPGLYCCLMNDCFDQEFKKTLIVELRARSVKVLANVVPDELFFSPFPMYYLAHKYKVDKDNFVEGFKKPDVRKSTKFGL